MPPCGFMAQAIEMAIENVRTGRGGPFAALVVKNEAVIGAGVNLVTSSNDPTAHAEIVAIRAACGVLGNFQLSGCEIYASCEPCPMCLGAIYWARMAQVHFAATREDAAAAGFDDSLIYHELQLPHAQRKIPMLQTMRTEARNAFSEWKALAGKISY